MSNEITVNDKNTSLGLRIRAPVCSTINIKNVFPALCALETFLFRISAQIQVKGDINQVNVLVILVLCHDAWLFNI